MLHGLVPTLQPVDLTTPAAASSSSQRLSFAFPQQTAPPTLGEGMLRRSASENESLGGGPPTKKASAAEVKKKKILMNKLDMKIKLGHEKLEELGIVQDDVKESSLLCLAGSRYVFLVATL